MHLWIFRSCKKVSPKSASLSSPFSLMSRFWGFRSRWRIFLWWQYDKPRRSWNINIYKDRKADVSASKTWTSNKDCILLHLKCRQLPSKIPIFFKATSHVSTVNNAIPEYIEKIYVERKFNYIFYFNTDKYRWS